VESERPHAGRAYERFTPEGPIALLPVGSRYALVWTTPTDQVAERLGLADSDFLRTLYAAFGERQGRFVAAGVRTAFPLRMALRGPGDTAGLVRIGNAAQLLHPVAGQGFNLGLRDAWQLAECILDSASGTLDAADLLLRYSRARGSDVPAGARMTDFLVDVFAHDPPVIAGLRGAALTALDLLPPLKNGFARKMMHGARTW
jgi:2-octaprenyl-6-methoxyphenol hydroxylase